MDIWFDLVQRGEWESADRGSRLVLSDALFLDRLVDLGAPSEEKLYRIIPNEVSEGFRRYFQKFPDCDPVGLALQCIVDELDEENAEAGMELKSRADEVLDPRAILGLISRPPDRFPEQRFTLGWDLMAEGGGSPECLWLGLLLTLFPQLQQEQDKAFVEYARFLISQVPQDEAHELLERMYRAVNGHGLPVPLAEEISAALVAEERRLVAVGYMEPWDCRGPGVEEDDWLDVTFEVFGVGTVGLCLREPCDHQAAAEVAEKLGLSGYTGTMDLLAVDGVSVHANAHGVVVASCHNPVLGLDLDALSRDATPESFVGYYQGSSGCRVRQTNAQGQTWKVDSDETAVPGGSPLSFAKAKLEEWFEVTLSDLLDMSFETWVD